MIPDKNLTDDVLDEIIAGAKTPMEQYLALSLKAEREAKSKADASYPDGWKLVPEFANDDMIEEGNIMASCMIEAAEKIDVSLIYGAMVAAAPQQEKK